MNKTELIDAVATRTGLDKKQAEAAASAFVDSVIAEVKAGSKVSVFGFGTFSPKSRAARVGRNPQTGASLKIAASKSVGFAPAAAFKTALNTRGGTKKTTAAKKAAPAARASAAKKTPAKTAKAPARATKSAKKR